MSDHKSAERAQAFLDACELVAEATSFGGIHSTAERRARWGGDDVPPGFIRLSAGVEATADLLLRRFPNEREGQLARRHAALVSARTLGEIAEAIGLKDHRIAYRGAPKATPTILADMLEALLGAIFLDAGFEAAAAVIERLWGERLGSQHPAPRPPKTQLQEWAQGRGLALPSYRQVGREGTEHEPVFLVEVTVGKLPPAQGRGLTKREAESAAASLMLEKLSSGS